MWDEQVLTVWVALVDATVENGCMQMVKGGHKKGRTATHTIGTTTSTWYTELSEETVVSATRSTDENAPRSTDRTAPPRPLRTGPRAAGEACARWPG